VRATDGHLVTLIFLQVPESWVRWDESLVMPSPRQ
jgi:hypothetical protein